MKALIRWLLFLFVGLPIQGLVYVLYPFAWLYWRLFVYAEPANKNVAQHEWLTNGTDYRAPDNIFLNTVDDHGVFCMYGAVQHTALERLIVDGSVCRRVNEDGSLNRNWVSGDVVISWCLSFTDPQMELQPVGTLLEFAWSYLKYLGTRSYDEFNKGDVSNRCNNFGVNYCPDSDAKGIGQPAAGPQFYTSSALFALASKHSYAFKVIFWIHWIVMGGWYWWFAPTLWTKSNGLYYVRDMTMRSLYVHKYVFGNRWWIRRPMEFITYETTENRNDLWYAMMGLDPVHPLPPSLHGFFSQTKDATSHNGDRMNGYYGKAIVELAKQARSLNHK
jgi:hypothetical protein